MPRFSKKIDLFLVSDVTEYDCTKGKFARIIRREVLNQFQWVQIFLQNRKIMLTPKFLSRRPMGPLGGHFLRGKFFETVLAENFTIDVDCIE